MSDLTPHPAKFHDAILDAIRELLPSPDECSTILDPFAGVGRVHELQAAGHITVGVEIEEEWADQHPDTMTGDALNLYEALDVAGTLDKYLRFDAIVTSPAYGNRMADSYAGDGTRRYSYRIFLNRDLSPNSGAAMHWGKAYRVFHRRVWAECTRVVRDGGWFILNIKDHPRNGRIMPVTRFHVNALTQLGWVEEERVEVETPGNRHGASKDLVVEYESVIRFRKEKLW